MSKFKLNDIVVIKTPFKITRVDTYADGKVQYDTDKDYTLNEEDIELVKSGLPSKALFPPFDALAYYTYEIQGRYTGLVAGEPTFRRRRDMDIVIEHNYYSDLFKLYGVQDRKYSKIVEFKLVIIGEYTRKAPYTEEGYKEIKAYLINELSYIKKLIEKVTTNVEGEK